MERRSAFETAMVTLNWSSRACPQLNCPKSLKPIFPESREEGRFVDGVPLSDDTCIEYSKVPTVMFHFQLGIDGEFDFIRKDLKDEIKATRKRLKLGREDSDLDIIQDHIENFGDAPLILEIIVDNLREGTAFIGLDLSTEEPD